MKLYDDMEERLLMLQGLYAKVLAAEPVEDHARDAKGRALSYLNGEICRCEFALDEIRNVMWTIEGPGSLKTDAKERPSD